MLQLSFLIFFPILSIAFTSIFSQTVKKIPKISSDYSITKLVTGSLMVNVNRIYVTIIFHFPQKIYSTNRQPACYKCISVYQYIRSY